MIRCPERHTLIEIYTYRSGLIPMNYDSVSQKSIYVSKYPLIVHPYIETRLYNYFVRPSDSDLNGLVAIVREIEQQSFQLVAEGNAKRRTHAGGECC